MDQDHLTWPFFEPRHRDLAARFATWAAANLREFESDEGGNGTAAREIFQRLGAAGWLDATLPDSGAGKQAAPVIRPQRGLRPNTEKGFDLRPRC